MKKILLSTLLLTVSALYSAAQTTATDFTANDCTPSSHHLFAELNAGKVIVLVWVMPCSSCIVPSTTTYNVVQSFQSAHPNTVYMYLCDDLANTTCASLNTWKTANNLTNSITFSDATINMADYGAAGMPKIVVIGGGAHTIFYNAINAVDDVALQAAISSALIAASSDDLNNPVSTLTVFPNPSSKTSEIKFVLDRTSDLTFDLFDMQGKIVKNIFSGKLNSGENNIKVNYDSLNSGTYLLRIIDGDKSKFINVVLAR